MHIDPQTILDLLRELEHGGPLDFGALALSEDDARRLVASKLSSFSEDLCNQGVDGQGREALALATAARLLLDNLALHYQLLSLLGKPPTSAAELLDAIRKRSREH